MQLLEKKAPQAIGLIGHTIINYPNEADALAIIEILAANKVDLIELQIPFSEPVADGPLFTKANHEAILSGVTLSDCFRIMAKVSAQFPIPFIFMTYANVVLKQGYENFIKKAVAAGAKGAVIPDLPLDLAQDYLQICRDYNFAVVPVVAPNISEQRLVMISPYFDGFIYAVARAGVTGAQTHFDDTTKGYIQRLRRFSNLPIAMGFGVSSAQDLNFLQGQADYAVIGSQTLRAYQEHGLQGVKNLWQELSSSR